MDNPISKATIDFITKDIDYQLEHETAISSWIEETIRSHNRVSSLIEYVLCSDDYILKINKEHLSHDYYTDIITFPLQKSPLEATIFISVDRVRENAELYSTRMIDELHRVMIHGILHLLGYNDKTTDEKTEMRTQEDKYLARRTFI